MAKKRTTNYFDIKGNIKKGFTVDELEQDASALLAVPFYTLIPTAFNLNGLWGMVAGFASTYLAGKAFGLPAMSRAAFAIAGTHLMYHHGNDLAKKINPEGIWSYGVADNIGNNLAAYNAVMQGLAESPDMYSLQPGATTANIGGEDVVYYPSAVNGLNEYIRTEDLSLKDYIKSNELPKKLSSNSLSDSLSGRKHSTLYSTNRY